MSSSLLKSKFIAISGSALAFAMLHGAPVWAQDEQQDDQAAQESADAKAEAKKEAQEEVIVVTGSRIPRSVFNSPAPIQIIDPEIERQKGVVDTAELIQSTPLAAGSSQITSAISSNFVTNGGQGASTISLRGLGAERTLVLLNGRRAGPAGTRGAVSAFDLNVLPSSLVKRVDILKDGASSIYGSDAVAGVVNLITKTDTDGIELDFYASPTFDGGGDQYRGSATWGKDWGNGSFSSVRL